MKDSQTTRTDILVVCPNPSVDTYVWMEQLALKAVNRAYKEQHFPGGKGIHVALALKELGNDVELLGFWGGVTGEWLIQQCTNRGIPCHGPKVSGWTRTCNTFKGSEDIEDTELLGAGPLITSSNKENFYSSFKKRISEYDLICMSGSWPRSSVDVSYAKLIKIANKAGKKVFLDCSGTLLKKGLAEKPFAVHINLHEGKDLFGLSDPKAIAQELGKHCEIAAVTAGADGLYFVTKSSCWHALCQVSKVFSTVGSGDCLLAGLIHACYNNMSMKEYALWGVACGAANCMNKDLGMIKRSDVTDLISKAEAKELETKFVQHE